MPDDLDLNLARSVLAECLHQKHEETSFRQIDRGLRDVEASLTWAAAVATKAGLVSYELARGLPSEQERLVIMSEVVGRAWEAALESTIPDEAEEPPS